MEKKVQIVLLIIIILLIYLLTVSERVVYKERVIIEHDTIMVSDTVFKEVFKQSVDTVFISYEKKVFLTKTDTVFYTDTAYVTGFTYRDNFLEAKAKTFYRPFQSSASSYDFSYKLFPDTLVFSYRIVDNVFYPSVEGTRKYDYDFKPVILPEYSVEKPWYHYDHWYWGAIVGGATFYMAARSMR